MHDIVLNMCHHSVTFDLKNLLVTLVLGLSFWTCSHVLSYIVKCCCVLSCIVMYCRVLLWIIMYCHLLSYIVIYCLILSYIVIYCHILSYIVICCHILSCGIMCYHELSCYKYVNKYGNISVSWQYGTVTVNSPVS